MQQDDSSRLHGEAASSLSFHSSGELQSPNSYILLHIKVVSSSYKIRNLELGATENYSRKLSCLLQYGQIVAKLSHRKRFPPKTWPWQSLRKATPLPGRLPTSTATWRSCKVSYFTITVIADSRTHRITWERIFCFRDEVHLLTSCI